MPGPNTYTKQDCLEIQAHGNMRALKEILDLVIRTGARLAEPGEFTLRAFLNGRIDLTQAEAVSDIINTKTKEQLFNAQKQLQGELREKVEKIRENIIQVLADVEKGIDFVEENIEELDRENRLISMISIMELTDKLIDSYDMGRLLKEGITILILGRPNAGKSTLMNALMGFERCIVTDIEGTTRDLIEDRIQWKGFQINIVDTMGLRVTDDPIETIGRKILEKKMEEADMILWVDDVTKENETPDPFVDIVEKKPSLHVLNKIDIYEGSTDNPDLSGKSNYVYISAKEKTGISELLDKIVELAFDQIEKIKKILQSLRT